MSNTKTKKDKPTEIRKDNFLCKTDRDSLTNQMNILNQLNHMNLTRGMSLSKLLGDPSKSKSNVSKSSLAMNKNLHMKSSISKKLLKAFKVSKKELVKAGKVDGKRKSLQYVENPRKFSNERISNFSMPEYMKTHQTIQREKSSKK